MDTIIWHTSLYVACSPTRMVRSPMMYTKSKTFKTKTARQLAGRNQVSDMDFGIIAKSMT